MSDWLAHYGRKGMKWHKHIFGKDPASKGRFADGEYKRESDYNSQQNVYEVGGKENLVQYMGYSANSRARAARFEMLRRYNSQTVSSIKGAVSSTIKSINRNERLSNVVGINNKKYRKDQIRDNDTHKVAYVEKRQNAARSGDKKMRKRIISDNNKYYYRHHYNKD